VSPCRKAGLFKNPVGPSTANKFSDFSDTIGVFFITCHLRFSC
jgi:hypothetical protein